MTDTSGLCVIGFSQLMDVCEAAWGDLFGAGFISDGRYEGHILYVFGATWNGAVLLNEDNDVERIFSTDPQSSLLVDSGNWKIQAFIMEYVADPDEFLEYMLRSYSVVVYGPTRYTIAECSSIASARMLIRDTIRDNKTFGIDYEEEDFSYQIINPEQRVYEPAPRDPDCDTINRS